MVVVRRAPCISAFTRDRRLVTVSATPVRSGGLVLVVYILIQSWSMIRLPRSKSFGKKISLDSVCPFSSCLTLPVTPAVILYSRPDLRQENRGRRAAPGTWSSDGSLTERQPRRSLSPCYDFVLLVVSYVSFSDAFVQRALTRLSEQSVKRCAAISVSLLSPPV